MKITNNRLEDDHFNTISDFKNACGFMVKLSWNGILNNTEFLGWKPLLYCKNRWLKRKWCNTADEVLEYKVGKDRLRDVITQVTVPDRTI